MTPLGGQTRESGDFTKTSQLGIYRSACRIQLLALWIALIEGQKGQRKAMKFRPRNRETLEATELTFPISYKLPSGEMVEAQRGDFIVTREDGSQFLAKRQEFLDQYEEVKPVGRKAGTRMIPKAELQEPEQDEDFDEDEEPVQVARPHPKPSQRDKQVPQPLAR